VKGWLADSLALGGVNGGFSDAVPVVLECDAAQNAAPAEPKIL
jgi:hypothetical protein